MKTIIALLVVSFSFVFAIPEMNLVVTKSFGQSIGYREWNQVVGGIKLGTYAIHTGAIDISGNITANTYVGYGMIVATANYAVTSNYSNVSPWSGVTGKPTTITGYGITDPIVTANYGGVISAPSYVSNATTTPSELEGAYYYDKVYKTMQYYNGTAWVYW